MQRGTQDYFLQVEQPEAASCGQMGCQLTQHLKTPTKQRSEKEEGRKDGNFPSFKLGVTVATLMLPPLSGLTNRKQRKDQKEVEIKRVKILKFFSLATGCHPSSMYRSARHEYSVQSKEK